MAKTWTENQARAIAARERDVCVAAGAGSGKTGVLVERFLQIIRDSLDGTLPPEARAGVGDILVITFTEKATKEMKGRIVEELMAAGLREQRRDVETAYISTIHGFCSRLLKENPFEAGVDPEFTVLDETEARRLLHNAFEDVVERAYALGDTEITELVAAAQDERVFGSDNRDPLSALEQSLQINLNRLRGAGLRVEQVTEHWHGGQGATNARGRAPVCALVNSVLNELHACSEAMETLKTGVMGTLEAIRRDVVARADEVAPLSDSSSWEPILATLHAIQEMSKSAARGARARANASPNEIHVQQELARLVYCAEAAQGLYNLLGEQEEQAETLCHRFWGLLAATWTAYDERKHALGVLDNDDLQAEAVRLLETTPGVRRRYQRRFRYLMIDEFQDTNALQMRLVKLLHGRPKRDEEKGMRDEKHPAPHPSSLIPRPLSNNLFLVGDVQQSIYGFRNADARIFQSIERAFRGKGIGEYISLAENFRARPELLKFVNYLFEQIWRGAPTPFMPLLPGAKHGEKSGPSVEFLLTRDTGRAQYVSTEAQALAVRIRRMVEGQEIRITDCGHPRYGEPVRYSDVAILLRGLTDIEKYEQVFLAAGLPYFVVGGGRGYYARREVRDVMNVLTVLDTPLDDVALAATLRSPMVGVDIQTLYALARFARQEEEGRTPDRRAPLYPALPRFIERARLEEGVSAEEVDALAQFYTLMEELRKKEDRLPVGQLLEQILLATQYDARLLVRPSGQRRLANVRKLLQMANAASTHGVADFIRRLREIEKISDREGDAPTEEEAADVVRILTIHKAKGLEFPVVFLGDLGRSQSFPERNLFLSDPESLALGCKMGDYQTAAYRTLVESRKQFDREEANRLLYVALTRAREHLILCGATGGRSQDTWANLVFGHLAVTLPSQAETRIGPGGITMRLEPMQAGNRL